MCLCIMVAHVHFVFLSRLQALWRLTLHLTPIHMPLLPSPMLVVYKLSLNITKLNWIHYDKFSYTVSSQYFTVLSYQFTQLTEENKQYSSFVFMRRCWFYWFSQSLSLLAIYRRRKLAPMNIGSFNYKEIKMLFEIKLNPLSLKNRRSSGMN